MDRSDEFDRERPTVEPAKAGEERTGDVLGLSGTPVPKVPGDPSAEDDPESVAKRRARLRSGEADGVSGATAERPAGATGVDMGAGGSGTEVSGD